MQRSAKWAKITSACLARHLSFSLSMKLYPDTLARLQSLFLRSHKPSNWLGHFVMTIGTSPTPIEQSAVSNPVLHSHVPFIQMPFALHWFGHMTFSTASGGSSVPFLVGFGCHRVMSFNDFSSQ